MGVDSGRLCGGGGGRVLTFCQGQFRQPTNVVCPQEDIPASLRGVKHQSSFLPSLYEPLYLHLTWVLFSAATVSGCFNVRVQADFEEVPPPCALLCELDTVVEPMRPSFWGCVLAQNLWASRSCKGGDSGLLCYCCSES